MESKVESIVEHELMNKTTKHIKYLLYIKKLFIFEIETILYTKYCIKKHLISIFSI